MTTADTLRSRLEDKPGGNGATMVLKSGRYFDFINPRQDTILIDDIAWALAHTCRFGGQCRGFYSVAQHSVLVSRMVPAEHAFAALLHDAAEAYIGDMVGPLKQLCPDFKAHEKRIERAIAARFEIPIDMAPEIKHADLRALRTEQRDITSCPHDLWNGLDAYPPHDDTIIPASPTSAYNLFLRRFSELWLQRDPAPQADKWITWNGGENPAVEETVCVVLRNGGYIDDTPSEVFRWTHVHDDEFPGAESISGLDVIAYRIVGGVA